MYNGKHSKASPRGRSRKPLITLVALVLILTVAVVGTVAWLKDSPESVVNEFTPGEVPITIVEKVAENVKSSVVIKNDGNVDAYIRVAVVTNCVDADGNVVLGDKPTVSVTDDWQQLNGYYYYKGTVGPGKTTTELLASTISLSGATVDILAQSIQVLGTTNDGSETAVKEAWGVDFDSANKLWS